jgi:hypothetical protein
MSVGWIASTLAHPGREITGDRHEELAVGDIGRVRFLLA